MTRRHDTGRCVRAHSDECLACAAVSRVTPPQFVHCVKYDDDSGTRGTKNSVNLLDRLTTSCGAFASQYRQMNDTMLTTACVDRVPKSKNTTYFPFLPFLPFPLFLMRVAAWSGT